MCVIVTDRWDATLGGRERYADDLVAHLLAEGRSVTKAVPKHATVRPGTRVLALTPVQYATHYQLHGGLAGQAFAAEHASLESDVRRTLFYPALRLNRRRQRLLREEVQLLEGRCALMAFSQSLASDLIERCGVSSQRVTVARPGVDLRHFHPPAGGPDGARTSFLRLAFVAHNFALKGLNSAIRAVAQAVRHGIDVTLSVAGRGKPASYQRLAATLLVADRVTFVGPLSQSQVAELYRASHALLHPTFYDPFPRVAIEALASACAVITTTRCGAAEILTPGVDSLLVPHATDVDELARAIAALADSSTLTRMRSAAAESGRRFDQVTHFRATTKWLFENDLDEA